MLGWLKREAEEEARDARLFAWIGGVVGLVAGPFVGWFLLGTLGLIIGAPAGIVVGAVGGALLSVTSSPWWWD